jgi:stage III sporulation protein SpoIIIAA
MIRKGVIKQTCTRPIAVALSVCWYIQMLKAKLVMLDARTEISCPSHMTIKDFIPAVFLLCMVYLKKIK